MLHQSECFPLGILAIRTSIDRRRVYPSHHLEAREHGPARSLTKWVIVHTRHGARVIIVIMVGHGDLQAQCLIFLFLGKKRCRKIMVDVVNLLLLWQLIGYYVSGGGHDVIWSAK